MAWDKLTSEVPAAPTGRQLPRAEAETALGFMVAADVAPTLTPAQIATLLDQARRVDSWGRHWDDDGWIETYDLNAAAATGWEWKAGLLSARFDIDIDGQGLQRSQLVKHAHDQAAMFRARRGATVRRSAPVERHRR